MSDVDTLRKAAGLMRERAKAATPGPWSTSPKAAYGSVVSQHADGLADNGSLDFEAYGGYLIGESITAANREHIAGMHPAVALAVADWLEQAARLHDGGSTGPLDTPAALRVARAYLGDAS